MGESGFWSSCGSPSFRSERPVESRSRYEGNDMPSYGGGSDMSSYGNGPNGERSFPPPPPRGGSFGNSSYSGRPSSKDREPRYGGSQRGMGPPHNDGPMGPPRGPMMGGGPPMGGGMDPGPPRGSRPSMGPPQGGNPGMPMGGGMGNSPNYGGGGGGGEGGSGGGGGGGGGKEADLFNSIQTLSQMSAQQNDIASKIISVLSTNLMGNMNGLPGPSPFPPGKMGGGYEEEDRKPRFLQSRSSSMYEGPRGGGSRPYGPPSGSGFDRFSRERRGRSPRGGFSGGSGPYKSSIDRHIDIRRSSSDLRGRLAPPKRSWSDTPPKDSYPKFKRHRGGSQERSYNSERREKDYRGNKRSSAGRHDESREDDDDEKSGKEDPKEDIATEALFCHMCKHGNFTSVKTYLFHLDGVRHRKTAAAFHTKSEATLDYLRKNAKLASIRFGGMDNSVNPSRCSICTALVKENFYKHKKLLEHRIVRKFLKPDCCGRYFKTRYDMDEHRLSLPHLKKVHKENEEKDLLLEDGVKGEKVKWSFDDAVKHLRSKNPAEDGGLGLTLDDIPPFDGNNFIGADLLEARDAIQCQPCQTLLYIGVKNLESHMASIEHYNAVVKYLREKKKYANSGGGNIEISGGHSSSLNTSSSENPKREDRKSNSDDEDEEDDDDAVAIEIRHSDDEEERQRDEQQEEEEQEEESGEQQRIVEEVGEEEEEDGKEDMAYMDDEDHIVLEEVGIDTDDVKEDE